MRSGPATSLARPRHPGSPSWLRPRCPRSCASSRWRVYLSRPPARAAEVRRRAFPPGRARGRRRLRTLHIQVSIGDLAGQHRHQATTARQLPHPQGRAGTGSPVAQGPALRPPQVARRSAGRRAGAPVAHRPHGCHRIRLDPAGMGRRRGRRRAAREVFDVPTVADNDAKLGALAESRFGAGVSLLDGVPQDRVRSGRRPRRRTGLPRRARHRGERRHNDGRERPAVPVRQPGLPRGVRGRVLPGQPARAAPARHHDRGPRRLRRRRTSARAG